MLPPEAKEMCQPMLLPEAKAVRQPVPPPRVMSESVTSSSRSLGRCTWVTTKGRMDIAWGHVDG